MIYDWYPLRSGRVIGGYICQQGRKCWDLRMSQLLFPFLFNFSTDRIKNVRKISLDWVRVFVYIEQKYTYTVFAVKHVISSDMKKEQVAKMHSMLHLALYHWIVTLSYLPDKIQYTLKDVKIFICVPSNTHFVE